MKQEPNFSNSSFPLSKFLIRITIKSSKIGRLVFIYKALICFFLLLLILDSVWLLRILEQGMIKKHTKSLFLFPLFNSQGKPSLYTVDVFLFLLLSFLIFFPCNLKKGISCN